MSKTSKTEWIAKLDAFERPITSRSAPDFAWAQAQVLTMLMGGPPVILTRPTFSTEQYSKLRAMIPEGDKFAVVTARNAAAGDATEYVIYCLNADMVQLTDIMTSYLESIGGRALGPPSLLH